MNISIPYSWLKEYIKTNAKVEDIARELSLHSFSVEKIEKIGGDEILEIEVTPNRGDALSVLGVARELRAVLPKQGFTVEWLGKEPEIPSNVPSMDNIDVVIKNKTLVPRFSAIIMDNITFSQSPKVIKDRLEKVGIRPLGNVIDVTNYMMIDKGQPMHVFDYDKIMGHKMIVRESTAGEIITTLDGVERKLPSGVIVIEDGEGRLIDLCGIMGAKNSEVDEKTKKILLFVQVYDSVKIRKASMSLGHRTDAALRFEKGIDYDGVVTALWESVKMMSELSGGKVSSQIVDIVNYQRKPKDIKVNLKKINKIAGIEIGRDRVTEILSSLGFETSKTDYVRVPSWRYEDISIPEDLAEEVIRIFGYYNLPAKLPEGQVPVKEIDESFYWEKVARYFLKYMGFYECYTYSSTSKSNADENAIKLSNPLSDDMTHLKTSLIPQLLDVVNKNQGYSDKIKVFELGTVYLPEGIQDGDRIPAQPLRLGMVTKGLEYNEFKGILESMFNTMGVKDGLMPLSIDIKDLGGGIMGIELDFDVLVKNASKNKSYTPITSFNSIKEDLTFEVPEGVLYPQILEIIVECDKRIYKANYKDIYDNYLTFYVEYLDRNKQISSDDTQDIRKKIFKDLERINVKLKL